MRVVRPVEIGHFYCVSTLKQIVTTYFQDKDCHYGVPVVAVSVPFFAIGQTVLSTTLLTCPRTEVEVNNTDQQDESDKEWDVISKEEAEARFFEQKCDILTVFPP